MDLSRFDYDLPEFLIAQAPATRRTQSRLLYVSDGLQEFKFSEITKLLNPGDLLITNNTKVMPARLLGQKTTGGKVEVMLERVIGHNLVLAQLKSSKPIKIQQKIIIGEDVVLTVLDRTKHFFRLKFTGLDVESVLKKYGSVPLPPYIKRKPDKFDDLRYQTVYAKHTGAVAAPTAGLHFDNELLKQIDQRDVGRCELTLHIGAGTFRPVRQSNVIQHKMHKEYYEIDAAVIDAITKTRKNGGRIIAVGTTTVRALESAAKENNLKSPIQAETDLFIYPGFKFQVADALLTNFHLPKSTLLIMVSAFGGYQNIMHAYKYAVKSQFRFFSYGDAMFIKKDSF